MTSSDRLSISLRRARHAAPLQNINLVDRPRLTARLDEALDRRLVVVAAPAGFGKTTLLAQWRRTLAARGATVAWLTLDDEDREIRRFLAGLIFAADDAGADVGQLRAWAEQGLTGQTPSDVAAALAEAASRGGGRFVFMLDDYHRAQTAEVNRILDRLLGSLAPGVTVAISTRTAPHPVMVRWLGFGQAVEVDAAMLRFSRDEALAVFGAPAAPRVFEDVFDRTEGWPIAMQLSRLVAERAPGRPVVPNMVGSGDLAAYLSDQVLSELSPDTQDFMLLTAHLDRFDADLANRALDRVDASALLEEMWPLGTILVALDDGRRWFRCHHLVAEVLQGLARRRLPARIGPTLARASLWFEARGETEDAVRYAARAGDHARCARLIEQAGGWRMILHGGIGRLRGLLSHMPDHALASYPRVTTARAYLAIKDGDLPMAERLVASAAAALAGAPDPVAACDLSVVGGLLEDYADRLLERDALQAVLRGRDAAAPDDHLSRGTFDAIEAWTSLTIGDFPAAADATQRAARALRRAGSLPGLNYSHLARGFGRLCTGDLDDAQEAFLESARLAEENFGADSGLRAQAQIGLSSLSFWRVGWSAEDAGRFSGALEHVRRYDGWFEVFAHGLEAAFAAADAEDDADAMRAWMQAARGIAAERSARRLADMADAFGLVLHVRMRDQAAAGAAARALSARFPLGCWRSSPFMWRCHFHAGLALARWARPPDTAAALARIDDVIACCRHIGADLFTTRALAARAEVLERAGRAREAADTIVEALSIAAARRIAAPFRTPGARALVQRAGRAAGDGEAARFASLCTRHDTAWQPARSGADALSPREYEVLCQLSGGGSNKAIARALGMTEHTVKFHMRSIFRKLGVATRVAAVAAALDVQGVGVRAPARLVR